MEKTKKVSEKELKQAQQEDEQRFTDTLRNERKYADMNKAVYDRMYYYLQAVKIKEEYQKAVDVEQAAQALIQETRQKLIEQMIQEKAAEEAAKAEPVTETTA